MLAGFPPAPVCAIVIFKLSVIAWTRNVSVTPPVPVGNCIKSSLSNSSVNFVFVPVIAVPAAVDVNSPDNVTFWSQITFAV